MVKVNAKLDTIVVDELEQYIMNNRDLGTNYDKVIKDYEKLIVKGTFDKSKAIKGIMRLINDGASKYQDDYGTPGDKWQKLFPMDVRKAVAESLIDTFLMENNMDTKASEKPEATGNLIEKFGKFKIEDCKKAIESGDYDGAELDFITKKLKSMEDMEDGGLESSASWDSSNDYLAWREKSLNKDNQRKEKLLAKAKLSAKEKQELASLIINVGDEDDYKVLQSKASMGRGASRKHISLVNKEGDSAAEIINYSKEFLGYLTQMQKDGRIKGSEKYNTVIIKCLDDKAFQEVFDAALTIKSMKAKASTDFDFMSLGSSLENDVTDDMTENGPSVKAMETIAGQLFKKGQKVEVNGTEYTLTNYMNGDKTVEHWGYEGDKSGTGIAIGKRVDGHYPETNVKVIANETLEDEAEDKVSDVIPEATSFADEESVKDLIPEAKKF